MASNVIVANFGPPPTRFAGKKPTDEFTSNIETSFGLIGYRGKVWSLRFRGRNVPMMRRDNPDEPVSSIEIVFVAASRFKSKVYYAHGYEGGNEKPTCFSSTGVAPDQNAQEKQTAACASCKWNVIGSGTNGRGKACSDSKRMAIVPANDIENIDFGGPMLLRIPAGSLNDFAIYADQLAKSGYPLYAVATRVSFVPTESYPKFKFSGIRVLTDEEIDKIEALRDNLQVKRILAESSDHAAPEEEEDTPKGGPANLFEQPVPPAPVTPKVTEAKPDVVIDVDAMADPEIDAKLDALLPK
jgi:hypothetical protein